jgi:hypothetical protein
VKLLFVDGDNSDLTIATFFTEEQLAGVRSFRARVQLTAADLPA